MCILVVQPVAKRSATLPAFVSRRRDKIVPSDAPFSHCVQSVDKRANPLVLVTTADNFKSKGIRCSQYSASKNARASNGMLLMVSRETIFPQQGMYTELAVSFDFCNISIRKSA